MKKKTILLSCCVFLILLLIGVCILFLREDSPKSGLLRMNGVDITQKDVMIYSKRAELPLTVVMKCLGMKVEWCDESIAEIIYNGERYILDISKATLVEESDEQEFNYLCPAPGGRRYFTLMENELLLDSGTIRSAMTLMGVYINIYVDRNEQVVEIFER